MIRQNLLLMSALAMALTTAARAEDDFGSKQESATGITHSFLAFGGETYILDDANKITRVFKGNTRDGWLLPNGNLLVASSNKGLEIAPDGKIVWQYQGTQKEVNTIQDVSNGRYMLTEAGEKPRILEVDRQGKVVSETPIQAQTKNTHLQTRMARKLPNGNYLVPQLLDKVVREYAPDGRIVWEAKTPAEPKDSWAFTAIRLENGNTLTNCTHGLMVVEFDKDGKIFWQLSNADLPQPYLADPCGAHRLPNGNTVICSYGQTKPGEVKLFEVTPDKKVVWTYRDNKKHGIHEVQILTTNGKALEGPLTR